MSHPSLNKVLDLLVDTVCIVDAEGRFVFVSAACERLLGYAPEELLGRNMIDFVFPEDRERTLQAAARVMDGQLQMHFENRYVRKDGRVVHIMWSARWSRPEGVRLAVARDITELKRAARMRSALYEISEAAHAAAGLPSLYEHIHHVIGDLLPAENFAVALYDQASETLSFPYFVDARKPRPEPRPLDPCAPVATVIQTGQPLLLTADDETAATKDDCLGWLGVPLIVQKGVMGALIVQTYSPSIQYTEEDKELLQFVCTQVATAIERKQQETRLRHMAGHDALTDLPNRALFHDRFDTALKRARRNGTRLALLFLDLNGFKGINDRFGHDAGDRVLKEVARRLTECVRASDTLGRMGGDEFTVLLPDIPRPGCVDTVAEKIRSALDAPFAVEGHSVALSVSVGTAVFPDQGESKDQLFRHADASMYAAKRRRH